MKNKLLKAGAILAVLAVAVIAMAGAGAAETVSDLAGLKSALENSEVTEITLGADITLGTDGTTTLDTLEVGRNLVLDLNGHTLTGSGCLWVISVNTGTFEMYDSGSEGLLTNGYVTGTCYGVNVQGGGEFVMISGTIGDCAADHDCVGVMNYGTFTMNGGTIRNCKAGSEGGGVVNKDKGTFEMNGGTIENCSSNHAGGVDNHGTFTMKNEATITNCSGYNGGGVCVDNGGTFYMDDGTISDCICTGGRRYGGGVFVYNGGKFFMNNGSIEHCKCTSETYGYGHGGGVYIANGGLFTIDNGTISECTANIGGGVYINTGDTGGTFSQKHGTISNCDALMGGGVYINGGGSFTLDKYKISGCTAFYGGGVYIANEGKFIMNYGEISGCTAYYGGGVYVGDGGSFTMNDGTISNNTSDDLYIADSGEASYPAEIEVVSAASAAAADTKSGGKVVINGGKIDGKVIDNGDMEIGGDAKITEIVLPSGKQITILATINYDDAEIGITIANLDKLKDPEEALNKIQNLKQAIEKGIVTCKNPGFVFKVEGDKVILVDKSGNPIKETKEITSSYTVDFGNSIVNHITFDAEISGTVTYIYGIGPASDGIDEDNVLGGFRIVVTDSEGVVQNVSGTITFTANSSYPAGVKLMHKKDQESAWEELPTKYQSGNTYTAVTESFSPFAIVQYAKPSTSSVTSFFGKKDGSDFTFEKAVVITKATLPGATYATVTNTSGSGWYTCNLSTDGTNGVLYFQVPLDVIDIKGYTINDVSLLGCKTTYLTSEGGYAKYSAVITKDGALTIDFEKDAATAAVEKVQEVVEQKQTATEQKQAAAEKVQETVEQKQTAAEQKQTAAKSPFPILGILAGLGIAGILVMRRH